MAERAKIGIEYHVVGDGREFLNYWDFMHGDDVVCEIKDGKLMLNQHDDKGEELPEKEISLPEFLRLVASKA